MVSNIASLFGEDPSLVDGRKLLASNTPSVEFWSSKFREYLFQFFQLSHQMQDLDQEACFVTYIISIFYTRA